MKISLCRSSASSASRARIRCPWWMGSKVPPMMPILMESASIQEIRRTWRLDSGARPDPPRDDGEGPHATLDLVADDAAAVGLEKHFDLVAVGHLEQVRTPARIQPSQQVNPQPGQIGVRVGL